MSLNQNLCYFTNIQRLSLNLTYEADGNGNPIDQVEHLNYLGITLDQHITWTPHIKKISITISRVIGILRKLKRTFPQYILRTIYNSLIHPHLIYGLNLWGFKHKRITTLQKKSSKNPCVSAVHLTFYFSQTENTHVRRSL